MVFFIGVKIGEDFFYFINVFWWVIVDYCLVEDGIGLWEDLVGVVGKLVDVIGVVNEGEVDW